MHIHYITTKVSPRSPLPFLQWYSNIIMTRLWGGRVGGESLANETDYPMVAKSVAIIILLMHDLEKPGMM